MSSEKKFPDSAERMCTGNLARIPLATLVENRGLYYTSPPKKLSTWYIDGPFDLIFIFPTTIFKGPSTTSRDCSIGEQRTQIKKKTSFNLR